MPTKKRRIGFIPRSEVLVLINELSHESNLSNSKIINLLVEEALYKRGILNIKLENNKKYNNEKSDNDTKVKTDNLKKNELFNFKNNFLNDQNISIKQLTAESLDNEIYTKFILFLKFQEMMKNTDL